MCHLVFGLTVPPAVLPASPLQRALCPHPGSLLKAGSPPRLAAVRTRVEHAERSSLCYTRIKDPSRITTMPLYEYKCSSCGDVFELIQKFSDQPLTVHEKCGGAVERLMSAPSLRFKGTGWYVTDYGKGNG